VVERAAMADDQRSEMSATTFGSRLRAAIKFHRYSQRQFAYLIGTEPAHISKMVLDKKTPQLHTLQRILNALPYADARVLVMGPKSLL
jgi:transcriptional regulator with XRE-family HTH domain